MSVSVQQDTQQSAVNANDASTTSTSMPPPPPVQPKIVLPKLVYPGSEPQPAVPAVIPAMVLGLPPGFTPQQPMPAQLQQPMPMMMLPPGFHLQPPPGMRALQQQQLPPGLPPGFMFPQRQLPQMSGLLMTPGRSPALMPPPGFAPIGAPPGFKSMPPPVPSANASQTPFMEPVSQPRARKMMQRFAFVIGSVGAQFTVNVVALGRRWSTIWMVLYFTTTGLRESRRGTNRPS
jgi:hypothetical protein